MTASLLNNTLTYLKHLAANLDPNAVGVIAILQGTRSVRISTAAEASNVIKVTGQITDQASQPIKAVTQVLVESFADSGTAASILTAVRVASAAALATVTAAGTGIGKTLTATGNGALTIDGVAVNNNDRVLIKNQVAGADNGVYTVTDKGSAGTPFILTRAVDFDTAAEALNGIQIPVTAGTANTGKTFVHTTAGVITIETTALTFADQSTFTVADLGGMTAGGTGTLKAGSATAKVWVATTSTGTFSLDVKNTQIGNVLLQMTTDNGESEQVIVAFA